jgi:hypothetical protein
LKNKKGLIAAITAAVASYIEEEKALRPAIIQRRPVAVSSSWSSSGREEIMRMRMLWQRRIVTRMMTFGCYPEMKL